MIGKLLGLFGYEKNTTSRRAHDLEASHTHENKRPETNPPKPAAPPLAIAEREIPEPLTKRVKVLKADQLDQLEEAIDLAPSGAQFRGSAVVFDGDDVKLVEITSKSQAQGLIKDARKGKIALVV